MELNRKLHSWVEDVNCQRQFFTICVNYIKNTYTLNITKPICPGVLCWESIFIVFISVNCVVREFLCIKSITQFFLGLIHSWPRLPNTKNLFSIASSLIYFTPSCITNLFEIINKCLKLHLWENQPQLSSRTPNYAESLPKIVFAKLWSLFTMYCRPWSSHHLFKYSSGHFLL